MWVTRDHVKELEVCGRYQQYSQALYHFGGNLNARYFRLSNFIVGC